MTFRTKLLLITIFPVILISLAALILINLQSVKLAREQGAAVEQMIRTSKQTELKNYTRLARTAIEPFYSSSWSYTPLAKQQVSDVIKQMTFGQDGYFFIYKEDGTNLVHPRLPELVGKNWIDLRDPNGQPVIKDLIELAKNGGDFYQYIWNKPSKGTDEAKLGYSIYLDKWDWMLGSGLYLDDISAQIASIKSKLDENVQQTRWVLLVLAFSAVFLTSLLLAFVRFSEQKFADERLQQMARQVVDAQELERKRVSTELHDGISQLLVSARYGLDSAKSNAGKKPSIVEPIEKSITTISTAISEVRRISMALRPSVLDDMGLASAIKSLGSDFENQTGIKVITKVENAGKDIDDRKKTTLYRVAQEALANIAKHSNASLVHVKLNRTKNFVCLEITDNGKGLVIKKTKLQVTGYGLGNMRERIENHGGNFILKRAKQGGLTIIAKLFISP